MLFRIILIVIFHFSRLPNYSEYTFRVLKTKYWLCLIEDSYFGGFNIYQINELFYKLMLI